MDNLNKLDVLKKYFGHADFRNGQDEMTDAILSGRDALGIMPTGAGKSICYQLPALMMHGITIVISPLISLMKDQVASLVQLGIPAAYINSSQTAYENRNILQQTAEGYIQLLYVTPERLESEDFIAMSKETKIAMITIDEAHCISQWGQDFRPSYLKIIDFIGELPNRPIVSAFTATATSQVKNDIAKLLKLNNPFIAATGFDRKNLYFEVQRPKDKFAALLTILNKYKDKNSIIYCSTRNNVEEVTSKLVEAGFNASYYHAGMPDIERHQSQDDFIYDRVNIMVATNAFGMGIDKSDVSLVVHYNMPKNIEGYYQEAGRAGRDGSPAECILLYSGKDVRINRFLIEKSRENNENNEEMTEEQLKENEARDLERLKQMTFYSTTSSCLREFILNYFGEKTSNFCGNCSSCNGDFEDVDITTDSQKIICCVIRAKNAGRSFGQSTIADILHGSSNEKIIKSGMDKLSTYGIMSRTPIKTIRLIMDYLISNGYMGLEGDEYPVLTTGSQANDFLKNNRKLFMKMPKITIAQEVVAAKPNIPLYPVDMELFGELKKLRAKLAATISVPAYIVFSDTSLRDMCAKLPKNRTEFMTVSGVGDVKADKYCDIFVNAISEYQQKKEVSVTS